MTRVNYKDQAMNAVRESRETPHPAASLTHRAGGAARVNHRDAAMNACREGRSVLSAAPPGVQLPAVRGTAAAPMRPRQNQNKPAVAAPSGETRAQRLSEYFHSKRTWRVIGIVGLSVMGACFLATSPFGSVGSIVGAVFCFVGAAYLVKKELDSRRAPPAAEPAAQATLAA